MKSRFILSSSLALILAITSTGLIGIYAEDNTIRQDQKNTNYTENITTTLTTPKEITTEILMFELLNLKEPITTTTTEVTTELTTIEDTTTEKVTEVTTNEVTTEVTTQSYTAAQNYTQDDIIWLARIIDRESSDVCSDEHKMWTGNIVLNRVKNKRFANDIEGVIFEKGQYSQSTLNNIYKYPSQRSLDVARRLLSGELVCEDTEVVYQSEFPQGNKTVKTIYNSTLGTTTYFCK